MIKWSKTKEADLQEGLKKGFTPARSERKNILLCDFGSCEKVAWEQFGVPVFNDTTGELQIHVFCCVEHQAAFQADFDSKAV